MTKVGKMFEIDRHTISKYQKELINLYPLYENQENLNDEYKYYFSKEDMSFIEDYLSHPNEAYDIIKSRHKGCTTRRNTLYSWLKILGKEKTEGKSKIYHYDTTKFSEIKTEEDAYWLGFITADGCIIENKWLQIQLAARDKEHIEKFCKYMGMPNEEISLIIKDSFGGSYTRDNPVNNVKICSKEIINNLQDKGIFPRKSGKEKPYICKNIELEKAYVRGLIDGDGYIRSTQYGMGIVGSYEICEYVQKFVTENIKDITKYHIRQHGIIFKLELSGRKQSSIILNALYENANIYLQRKYDLYVNNYKKFLVCRD